jgi:hypothetical protein
MEKQRRGIRATANDRSGDIAALGKNPPQVRAKNQDGHARRPGYLDKDLIAAKDADWEYTGGAGRIKPSERKKKPQRRIIGPQTQANGAKPPIFYKPLTTQWGGPGGRGKNADPKNTGWIHIPEPDDADVEAALTGNRTSGQKRIKGRSVTKPDRYVTKPDGFVMGQRTGRFCPGCSLALPVTGQCDNCR